MDMYLCSPALFLVSFLVVFHVFTLKIKEKLMQKIFLRRRKRKVWNIIFQLWCQSRNKTWQIWSAVKVFLGLLSHLSSWHPQSPDVTCVLTFLRHSNLAVGLPGWYSKCSKLEFCNTLFSLTTDPVCVKEKFPSAMKGNKLQKTSLMFWFRLGVQQPLRFHWASPLLHVSLN